ncbi:MAG TPA: NifB/NifX family molybdenum-iron cluster-binding protein [Bacteroidales bacterium]|nr:NifB/NifX family molybdenum-iron cluster-binding protein [Bacteroidales bacterium]
MKIAITSTGNAFTSKLDQRFGRCSWFVFFDTESQGAEFLPNPFKDAEEGSGASSISLLTERKVKKIISGEFGIKVKPLLDSHQIQMIILKDCERTIQEIIDLLNHKKTEK